MEEEFEAPVGSQAVLSEQGMTLVFPGGAGGAQVLGGDESHAGGGQGELQDGGDDLRRTVREVKELDCL